MVEWSNVLLDCLHCPRGSWFKPRYLHSFSNLSRVSIWKSSYRLRCKVGMARQEKIAGRIKLHKRENNIERKYFYVQVFFQFNIFIWSSQFYNCKFKEKTSNNHRCHISAQMLYMLQISIWASEGSFLIKFLFIQN